MRKEFQQSPLLDKSQIRRVMAEIRRVLWERWDPIGVNDTPEASDEYHSYAPGVYSLLLKGASDTEIADYLRGIETESMGLTPGSSPQDIAPVVVALRTVDLEPPSGEAARQEYP